MLINLGLAYEIRNPCPNQMQRNDDFHWFKALGICNCQIWVFHDFVEIKHLFPEDLVANLTLVMIKGVEVENLYEL